MDACDRFERVKDFLFSICLLKHSVKSPDTCIKKIQSPVCFSGDYDLWIVQSS